ncbi:Lipase, GDSL, partial [Cynara cardunculus var. scolymus]
MAMASRTRNPELLVVCIALFGVLTTAAKGTASKTMGPVFIFGDSTVDVGTNNHLNCTARPLPFLALVEDHSNFTGAILNGVNFASGGAGLAKDIGQVFGEVISLEEQIQQFATVRGNITALLGESRGDLLLQSSMYILSIGSNDIMTYIFTHSMTPELFITNLTDTYAIHIKNLHNMGARKFGILSVAAIGCCPMARAYNGGPCGDEPNDLARAFYVSVQSLLQNFSSTLEGFKQKREARTSKCPLSVPPAKPKEATADLRLLVSLTYTTCKGIMTHGSNSFTQTQNFTPLSIGVFGSTNVQLNPKCLSNIQTKKQTST